ncbi:MAG: CvpA family protein [Alphaproteobacteria bacterium]|nr:CvpA family protein [Alphaproteobacteria bacterium]
MEQLNNLDVIFLIITGISALVGIARGMTKELLSLVGWILAAVSLFYLVPMLNPYMEQYVASKLLSNIVTAMAVLIVFSIIWILTADKLASSVRSSKLSAIDRILGFVFGVARGALIVVLIALMLSTMAPNETKKGIFAESQIYKQAEIYVEPLKNMIPQSWIDTVKEKSASLGFGKSAEEEEETEDKQETADNTAENTAEVAENKENEVKEEKPAEEENDEMPNLSNTLEFIDSNLEMLQKNGEELFNQLAQPKTQEVKEPEAEAAPKPADELISDLDKLLDVLEDKVVVTDEKTPEMKSETQKITDKVKGNK